MTSIPVPLAHMGVPPGAPLNEMTSIPVHLAHMGIHLPAGCTPKRDDEHSGTPLAHMGVHPPSPGCTLKSERLVGASGRRD